jgi:hypothetical protein
MVNHNFKVIPSARSVSPANAVCKDILTRILRITFADITFLLGYLDLSSLLILCAFRIVYFTVFLFDLLAYVPKMKVSLANHVCLSLCVSSEFF